MTEDPVTEHEPGFPLNRIVAFLGPQIAILAGFIATWLVEHLEFLHLDATGTAGLIANLITFVLVSGLTWAGQHKWLDGWQKWENNVPPVDPEPLNGPHDIDTEITEDNLSDVSSVAGIPAEPLPVEQASDLSPSSVEGDEETGATRGMPLGFDQKGE